MKQVGVFIIHGMGIQKNGYSDELINDIQSRLGDAADHVVFEACLWADIVQEHQNRIWGALNKEHLDAKGLRKFVLGALGDPVMYLSGYFRQGQPVYAAIHACVSESLRRLKAQLADANNCPIVVLAHSLGSVIISNYIWDEQHPKRSAEPTKYESTETVTRLITFGYAS